MRRPILFIIIVLMPIWATLTVQSAPAGSCITGARFQNTMPPNNRKTVDISGSNLKQSAGPADVQSFGTDAADHSGDIHSAQSTKNCSAGQCTAVLVDGANWDTVSVRMLCGDGQWSGWIQVEK